MPKFVIVHFDTRNGRAPHIDQLKVQRNCTYGIVLHLNGKESGRVENPKTLKPVIKLLQKMEEGWRLLVLLKGNPPQVLSI